MTDPHDAITTLPATDHELIERMKRAEAKHRAQNLHACERCRTVFHGEHDPTLVLYPETRIELEIDGAVQIAGPARIITEAVKTAAVSRALLTTAQNLALARGRLAGAFAVGAAVGIGSVLSHFAGWLADLITFTTLAGWALLYLAFVAFGWWLSPDARRDLQHALWIVAAGVVGVVVLWLLDGPDTGTIAAAAAVIAVLGVYSLRWLSPRPLVP